MYRPRMPVRMRLTLRRPLATAVPAHPSAPRVDKGPVGPCADTPTATSGLFRTSARVPFAGGTTAFTRATAGRRTTAPAPAPHPGASTPHPTHRVPKGGR
ncbi:Secreted protein OS=Streptomyces tendae OX=1932 GN=GUR47_02515 PE=4 SV=1 [Streptomyces tendae]